MSKYENPNSVGTSKQISGRSVGERTFAYRCSIMNGREIEKACDLFWFARGFMPDGFTPIPNETQLQPA